MASKRALAMASLAEEMAESSEHGYSQKPPSGRWGPDFDCSSFIYYIADAVGYDVGTGRDKVRFTGTMLEHFKDAGFQILPFANVGLGELEVGDILLNLALHAEVYVGDGQVVGAQGSETGGYVGMAGDQTGDEIKKQPAYIYDKGWDYVLRPPEEEDEEQGEEPADEGDEEMPYPYGANTMGNNAAWTPNMGNGRATWMPPMQNAYANPMYPQGNLGQMNGYSSANAGYPQPNQSMGYGQMQGQQGYAQGQQGGYPQGQQGYPQGQMDKRHLIHVNDLNEVRDVHVNPEECVPVFIGDGKYMALKSADREGFPSMRVFELNECSEEMPQHFGGENYGGPQMPMQQSQGVSRAEFDQLKEMIANVQSVLSGSGFPQGNGNGSANSNGGQSNGGDSSMGSNGRQSSASQSRSNGRNS